MDPKLLQKLDTVLDDVIDMLEEAGWEDEAEWYADLRRALLEQKPGSRQFGELLAELDASLLGPGTLSDIPLAANMAEASEAVSELVAQDTHQQRLGLASCASGIVQQIRRATR